MPGQGSTVDLGGTMTTVGNEPPAFTELLKDSPKNWGKWGPDDEVGSLNYLTPEVVVKAAGSVKSGKVFTLQVKMANPEGDPVWPGRAGATASSHGRGLLHRRQGPAFRRWRPLRRRLHDVFLQGSTQYDALGHVWYDDQIWNGYDSKATIGGMSKASVLPIAERGIVGRGILLDIARYRNKEVLDVAETFTHEDLIACAKAQGTEIQKNDVLVIRTGWIAKYYKVSHEEFYGNFVEPGLTYSPELVQWFHDMEIPNLVTDTIANEVTSIRCRAWSCRSTTLSCATSA